MAFVVTWEDGIIQTFDDSYTTIEDALYDAGVRKEDVMRIECWEDTDGWKLYFPWEIDIDQLKK